MGMGASFGKEDFHAPVAEINMTPFVDVMLVLLVIFLVTAPMLTHAVKLELPSETTTELRDRKAITLSIDAAGTYYWNDAPIPEDALDQRLKDAALQDKKQPFHLRADTATSYGKVSHLLAAAQRAGLTNIGFLTQPE
jgi:biopolymer transport protein ExbD